MFLACLAFLLLILSVKLNRFLHMYALVKPSPRSRYPAIPVPLALISVTFPESSFQLAVVGALSVRRDSLGNRVWSF